MRIYKIFTDYAKEEKWLNEMAQKGYEVVGNCFGYKFKRINPDNETYRIDCRTFKTKNDFIDYCTMFEDSGWKHILGSKSSGKQYFKKISDDSHDDIFSDNISKAARYKRASNFWLSFASCYFVLLVSLAVNGLINLEVIKDPKILYYTPGLWEMTGINFWCAFLFETPFALGRGFIWMIYPIGMLIFLYFSIKASRLYKKTKKQVI